MALLQDIAPLFYGARLFGCTPHRVTTKDILVTRWGYLYSLVLALVFLYACVTGVYLITVDNVEKKILFLIAVRTVMSYICFFTDAILTMIWNEKLRNALGHMHGFDVSTKFSEKINFSLLNRCRLALCVTVLFWSLVGYVSYRCEKSSPLFNGITYGIVNAAMSMQLLKFIGFLILLYQRFAHLGKLILPEGNVEMPATLDYSKIVANSKKRRIIELHDVWWLHSRLITSADEINSVYTTQLLFWITTMFLNALSRIYTLTGEDMDLSFFKIRETLSVTACLFNLFIITAMCHFTAAQVNYKSSTKLSLSFISKVKCNMLGNKVGGTMFSPRSVLSRKRCFVEDNIEVGAYFHLRKLKFSAGAGFIRIDLPLLLSIGGAMTTYLVILHALNNN